MTYQDIKQRVFDILQFDSVEATRLGYTEKVYRIANECLFRIANSVYPYLREYKFRLTRDALIGKKARVSMPPDFLSFANEQDAYLKTYTVTGEILSDNQFVITTFISNNEILVNGKEIDGEFMQGDIFEYSVFYNAYYPRLIDGGNKFEFYSIKDVPPHNTDNWDKLEIPANNDRTDNTPTFEIPTKIGDLIPHYIVGQLLTLDDKVRSITELNEFEVMLSQLELTRNERQREYRSVKGWY